MSENRLKALLHLSGDWYSETDAQHRFTFISAGFASSNAEERHYLGKTRWEIPGLEPAGGWDAYRATLDATLPYRDVLFVRTLPNGEQRYFMACGEPIFDARGTFSGYRGTVRDVSAQRRAEIALRESRTRFETMVWHVPGIVFRLLERNGASPEVLYVNAGAAAVVFDTTPAALQADPCIFVRMIVPEDHERFEASRQQSAASGAVWNWEGRIRSRQGEEKWLNVRATPQRIDADTVVWDGLVLNITQNKRAEEELRDSQRLLRELAARRESAREEERARIAREVHDELGQALTALRMELATLAVAYADAAPGITERVAGLKSSLDQTIRMVRNVAAALRPASLDLGLVPAVEWLASEFKRRSGIACTLELPEAAIGLGDSGAAVVFRILQESLTNVLRHAGAKRVEIRIVAETGGLRLEVADDGCGFDPQRAGRERSFGLLGMRERAMMLGGELVIRSAPGHGTCVRLFVPHST